MRIRRSRRGLALLAAPPVLAVVATGCQKVTDDASGDPDRNSVTITIADSGCTADPVSVPAGPTTFQVVNDNAQRVTEAELIDSTGRIVGERENLTAGLSAGFSLSLSAGTYSVYCPGADTETIEFTVTGDADATDGAGPDERFADGVAGYADFVRDQTGQLVEATTAFTDAVRAGDVEKARSLYGPARVFYERIEPVAESFGDLDPRIDARINDVPDPAQWTGFHAIERGLWEAGSTDDLAGLADQLDADVADLDAKVRDLTYQPADLANGATGLLEEVSASKITGEEEAYSHLDLLDFWANVDGAKRAFDLLGPGLEEIDPDLRDEITDRFADMNQALAQYRDGDSFVPYGDLTPDQVTDLAGKVDALAEPLSGVAERIVTSE